jgi:hypothetical protein
MWKKDKATFSRCWLSPEKLLWLILSFCSILERTEKKIGKKIDSLTVNVVAVIRTITFYTQSEIGVVSIRASEEKKVYNACHHLFRSAITLFILPFAVQKRQDV